MKTQSLAAVVLVLLALRPSPAIADDRYLQIVGRFVDTMIAHGTDHYGEENSPLFAAMLDLRTLSLPVTPAADESYWPQPDREVPGTQRHYAATVRRRLPKPPVGTRWGDRAPFGNNLEHDILLLRTMYKLTELTGEEKYAAHANAYIKFWLRRCQSPETGLMASGEHNSWDFVREWAHSNIHEVFRHFPFWDKLYAIDPYRASRIAEGMWMSQVGDKRVGDFNRHAGYATHEASAGAAYPRHAGFYIWAYANAYVQTRDPKYIERIEVLIESRTGKQARPYSLLVNPGSWQPARSTDATLRLLLWEAAGLVPSRTGSWRRIVTELDEIALAKAEPAALKRPPDSPPATEQGKTQTEQSASPSKAGSVLVTRGGVQWRTTLSPLWIMGYGSSGLSGTALLEYTRYKQTGDKRFLRRAESIADAYLAEGLPSTRQDLWPKVCGQVISLMVSLSGESPNRRGGYIAFAEQTAQMAIDLFSRNGLFRADGLAEHYEAITGADDLLWGLLQLHCALNGLPDPGHNDVNW